MTADHLVWCLIVYLILRSVLLQWRLARVQRECEWRDANLQRAVYDLCGWLARLDDEKARASQDQSRLHVPQVWDGGAYDGRN